MKKVIIALAFLLVGMAANGQTVDEFIKKYKKIHGVHRVHVGKTLLTLAALTGNKPDLGKGMKLKSVDILALESDNDTLKESFLEDFSAMDLDGQGYELLTKTTADEGKVNLYARMDGDVCRELVVLTSGDEGIALIQLFGKMDIEKVMDWE